MDFVCLILFLVMYFFRPQEWFGLLNTLHPVQLLTVLAVYALFSRDKGLKISDLFKTPHDWVVFAYFSWMVFASSTHWETFKAIESVILFYIIGVQALSDTQRIKKFLGWWALSLLVISALAVASQYGFDPFGSYDLTNWNEKGRLALNLSIFNNPNGLGHSIVPVIPMVYFLFFWKNTIGKASVLLLGIPLYCIYLTQSKGAFLCSFATIITTLTFGRPKVVQISILVFAGVFGTAALYALPRMNELQKTKSNEAIGGRVAAFKFGYQMMQTKTYGIGLGNFSPEFLVNGPMERFQVKKRIPYRTKPNEVKERTIRVWRYRHYSKASHSAYNQNGAELGYTGFILFIATLYSCLRTLISMSKGSVDEERVRRALFAVVISYAVSSWMVDFAYRPTFFLFVAATGAFHRIIRAQSQEGETLETEAELAPVLPWRRPALAAANSAPITELEPAEPAVVAIPKKVFGEVEEPEEKGHINWRRIGLIDIAFIGMLTVAAVRFWQYSIRAF